MVNERERYQRSTILFVIDMSQQLKDDPSIRQKFQMRR